MKTENQFVALEFPDVFLSIKREDLIHPYVSGNKFRKLKYNLLEAKGQNCTQLLTFGGAFSNHIAAVAFAGKQAGFKTVGIIRGDELLDQTDQNPTLKFASGCGMTFKFISRKEYRFKIETAFIERLQEEFGGFYLIPEGGTNDLAVKGCAEILTDEDSDFDFICCAVGTGGTISGLINSAAPHQKILGFPALKGDFLKKEICKFATEAANWDLITDYHFGGYGKINDELVQFMNQFFRQNQILLDPVYTGKMIFGVIDLIQKGYFPKGAKILAIHTGGIQGIEGMNVKLKNKKSPLIETK